VGERPWRATEAEQALAGELGQAAFEAAAAGAARQATGFSDGYRANVVGALTRRALVTAVDRIGGVR
jgi:CO/xanthine dehydrogenase FAD-binding subunit